MRKFKASSKLLLGAALVGFWVPQVQAQSTAPEDADESAQSKNNEIVVTARRIDESLQDVPLTVNVVTDRKLKDLNLFNGSDLAAVVPGLNFAPTTPGNTPTLGLRGAARGAAGGRLDPTVQTYLNEAPVSDVMVYQALYDIGQVEVLRGPQGTLRGRPSSSGAITITTKRPDLNEVTGYVSLAVSSLDQMRGEAAVGLPIIKDVLAVRVAGIVDRNDGDGVRSLFSGRKSEQELDSWRVSVRFQPIEALDINVMYQDFKSVRTVLSQVAGTGYQGPSTPPLGATAPLAGFNGPAISAFDRLSVVDVPLVRDEHHTNLIGQVNLDLGTHRISYVGEYNKTRNINSGGTNVGHIFPIPYPDPQLKTLDGRSKLTTSELRFETTGADFWDYGVGVYYEKTTSDNIVDSVASYLPGTFGRPRAAIGAFVLFPGAVSLNNFNYNYNLILQGNFPVSWKNQAIYANSTFHITPETDLFLGARHVWYEQSSDQIGNLLSGLSATGFPTSFCGSIPARPGPPATSAGFASTAIPEQCDVRISGFQQFASNPLVSKEKAWVYNASLTHRFSDDMTAYLSFGHSWRPQTNNLNLQSTDSRIRAFANTSSETSDNFEVGLKMQAMDRKLTVNVAAFYQKYDGFLFSALGVPYVSNTTTPISVASAASLTVNADAKVKGFDLELGYRPSKQFSISGNINYARGRLSNASVPCNDANADGIPDATIPTLASFGTEAVRYCNSNSALAFQSDWNASMQAEYNMPVSNHTDAYIRTLINYTPKNKFAPGSFTADSYGLLNLYIGARANDGQWDIGAYARNLTETEELVGQGTTDISTPPIAQSALGLARSAGYRSVTLTPRREFGLTFRFNW